MNNNELYHYGILGMKWGRRRADTRSEDSRKASSLKKKKLNELSNNELKELNKRMNLESQYRQLKRQNISNGRKLVNDIIGGTAKIAASAFVGRYMNKGLNYVESRVKGGIDSYSKSNRLLNKLNNDTSLERKFGKR